MKLSFFISLLLSSSLLLPSAWEVPNDAKLKQNIFTSLSDKQLAKATKLYKNTCLVCHGSEGKGDGPGSKGTSVPVSDLTSTSVQSQTDGAIFYKIETGRNDMPAFGKTGQLNEKKIWLLVSYIRTLKSVE